MWFINISFINLFGGVKYLFEVSSSGSLGAVIKVDKCSGSFTETVYSVEQDSNNSSVNDSLVQNESISQENTSTEDLISSENLQDKSFLLTADVIFIMVVVVITILIFIVFVMLYKLYKENKKSKSNKK